MRYSNLHTHTVFSDGKHTMEENIVSAVEKNMLSLGFSDHSYTACDPFYCMQRECYEPYLQALQRLKTQSSLPIYAGLELDAFSDDDVSPFDYIIASVHYVCRNGVYYPLDHAPELQQKCIRDGFGGDVLELARCYCDTLGEHVAKVKPTCVGHFDLLTKFSLMPETDDRYQSIMADGLSQIMKICPYIELNTGAISRGWRETPYPAGFLLELVRDNGGKLVLGSDSHGKDHLTYWFDKAVALVKAHGIDCIHVFNGTGFDPMEI